MSENIWHSIGGSKDLSETIFCTNGAQLELILRRVGVLPMNLRRCMIVYFGSPAIGACRCSVISRRTSVFGSIPGANRVLEAGAIFRKVRLHHFPSSSLDVQRCKTDLKQCAERMLVPRGGIGDVLTYRTALFDGRNLSRTGR